jgi:glycerophosphoryl diester phosphodiesterase
MKQAQGILLDRGIQALEDGADVLELDVHETSDGVLVVMHDGTVDRTTDCTGPIKEMTFDELRLCDAGYDFTPMAARHIRTAAWASACLPCRRSSTAIRTLRS